MSFKFLDCCRIRKDFGSDIQCEGPVQGQLLTNEPQNNYAGQNVKKSEMSPGDSQVSGTS